MGSSSRPQRQARSSVRSYRDAFSDDDHDDDFSRSAIATAKKLDHENINNNINRKTDTTGRRSLALKKSSCAQERANAKERAEAVQLQRAISESLSKDTRVKRRSLDTLENSKDVGDSEDEIVNAAPGDSVAFQCLLDVASEVNAGNAIEAALVSTDNEVSTLKQIEQPEPINPIAVQEGSTHLLREDDESSYEEEEDDDTEDESSDVSEDSGCKRKRPPKVKQKGKAPNEKKLKENLPSTQMKKARSTRPVIKPGPFTVKGGSSAGVVGKESTSKFARSPGGKENIPATYTTTIAKNLKKPVIGIKKSAIGATVGSCQTMQRFEASRKTDMKPQIDHAFCDSLGILNFQAQSVHRRVIGLSRRFRPPPLHPYLSRTDS